MIDMSIYVDNEWASFRGRYHRQTAVPKITRQQIQCLKAMGATMDIARHRQPGLLEFISEVFSDFHFFFSSLLAPKKVNPMCQYYGHVIKNLRWKGYWPICADCGIEITSPSMLRRSEFLNRAAHTHK